MEIIDLRCRFIRDDNNMHSFQIYNATSGNVIWSPPNWWTDRKEAEQEAERIRARLMEDMKSIGIQTVKNNDGEEVLACPSLQADPKVIIMALAVHRQTGRYGFVVMTDAGEILMRPEEYYDTAEEAYHKARDSRDRIMAELQSWGMEGKILFLYLNKDDFVSPTPQSQPDTSESKKSISILQYPPNFDPTVN